VVPVLDFGAVPGEAIYMVMPEIKGEILAVALERAVEPFSIARACRIVLQILAGLAALHSRGIVHRDLKPGNVMLTEHGDSTDWVMLFDLGIAARVGGDALLWEPELTPAGQHMGTPLYASPEQIRGDGARDIRVDIHGAGLLFYAMLTGHHAYGGDTIPETCDRILREPPPPMSVFRKDVPEGLEAIVRRALEKDPSHRYRSASAMKDAIEDFSAGGIHVG